MKTVNMMTCQRNTECHGNRVSSIIMMPNDFGKHSSIIVIALLRDLEQIMRITTKIALLHGILKNRNTNDIAKGDSHFKSPF